MKVAVLLRQNPCMEMPQKGATLKLPNCWRICVQPSPPTLLVRAMTQRHQKNHAMHVLADVIPSIPSIAHFYVRINSLSFGIKIMNSATAMLSMAHLYRAARHYGLIESPWQEMDFILANFVGPPPALRSHAVAGQQGE